ncbi:MAG TPA: F0F1 ATP synthase subunit B [Armatimonadota bacterium]
MGIIQTLGIEWPVVIAQAISFVLLVVVLSRFLYRPISNIMAQRQEQIANNLSAAEAQQQKAEALRREYEGHLANIADEARAKLDQALKDAEAARLRLLETAQSEVRDLHTRQQAQLALEREQLRRDLRAEMSDIAVTAATKALRGGLDPATQSNVLNRVIQELGQLPPQQFSDSTGSGNPPC